MILRGINRSGFEYLPEAQFGVDELNAIDRDIDKILAWGANVVRLPFNQAWALRTSQYDPEPYLNRIERVIQRAAAQGAYTLLDLQWLDAVTPRGHLANGAENFVPPLPDLNSIELWRQLARRFAYEPAVLYDVFNEPHNPLIDDPMELVGITERRDLFRIGSRRVSMAEWQPWARHLVRVIREEHPTALIFVSGVDWGYDLEGFPIYGIDGVVYSSHVYPNKKKPWKRAFGNLARSIPVFVAEWGGGENDLDWGRELMLYLQELEIGWTAWSWTDHPRLTHAFPYYEPTAFGRLVRDGLETSTLS